MKLTDTQKDYIGIAICLTCFWLLIGYFVFTQPNYMVEHKAPIVEKEHIQSPVLDAYGELFTKHAAQ